MTISSPRPPAGGGSGRPAARAGSFRPRSFRPGRRPPGASPRPQIEADFRHTFAALRGLPCDIFLGAHGAYFDLLPKLERASRGGPAVFVDPGGYRRFVAESEQDFEPALRAPPRPPGRGGAR